MSMSVGPVATLEKTLSDVANMDLLAEEVRRACGQPVNVLQIAALLESAGVTEAVARQRYQHASVFALAEQVARLMLRMDGAPVARRQVVALPQERSLETVKDYMRGPLALLPIVLLSLTIMAYQGFEQWRPGQVLALSIAMIGSLLVTSGFVQAFARKGSSYLSQGYVRAAQRVVNMIIGVAVVVVIFTAGLFAVLLRWSGWLSPDDIGLMAVSYVALSLLWLASGVLSLLKQAHWFGGALAAGLGLSYLCLRGLASTPFPRPMIMLLAVIMGMTGTLMVVVLVVRGALSREAVAADAGNRPIILAPAAQLVVGLVPYFGYGVLYIVFILSGHVGGWLGAFRTAARPMEAVGTVEMGLTVAVGGFILASGVAERTMRRFWERVQVYQTKTVQTRPDGFGRMVREFFLEEQSYFLAALVFCSFVVAIGLLVLLLLFLASGMTALPWSNQATVVFVIGLVGYGMMAAGLFSCMFMITLSQPWAASSAVVSGIAVAVVTGLAFSNVLPYQYATLNVVAGGLALMLISRKRLWRILKDADYFYYTSF